MQLLRNASVVSGSLKAFGRPAAPQAAKAAMARVVSQPCSAVRLLASQIHPVPRLVVCLAAVEDSATDTEAPSNRLFVGNLAWSTDRDSLAEHFRECEGFVGARVATDFDSGRSRGFGFVEFDTSDQATAALEFMQETQLDGRNLLVRMSTTPNRAQRNSSSPRYQQGRERSSDRGGREYGDRGAREYGENRRQPREVDSDTTLFVGNLPYGTRWQELKDLFSEAGSVAFVEVATGRDGRSKGFATIRMASPDAAEAAIDQLNGQDVGGRAITVRRYEQQPPRYARESNYDQE